MGFFSNNLLKAIEWQDDSRNTIVYKYPIDGRKIMYGSKLTVRESQAAVFVNKGKIADIFEPGMYKLQTSNLPFLTQLLSLPYGFRSPFYADVYFVNTKQFTNLKWGTSNPITLRDKEFGTIRIKGFGTYAFRVINPKVFLQELFGTNSSFSTEDIEQYLKSILVSSISDTIAESNVSALDMASNLQEFAGGVKESITSKFLEYGLELTNLVIENISFPEAVEKAIDERSSMGVLSSSMDDYVRYTAINAMKDAANNQSGMNMASTGVGIGSGLAMSEMLKDSLRKKEAKSEEKRKVKKCIVCGHDIDHDAKFCDDCGSKQELVCPSCGAKIDNPKAKFCDECGAKLK